MDLEIFTGSRKQESLLLQEISSFTKLYWDPVISGTRPNYYKSMMMITRRKEYKLLLKTFRILLARNLLSRKEKKYNLHWEDVFGCRPRKIPGRKQRPRKSPRKITEFFLTSKHIRILNLLDNLLKHLKEFWTLWEDFSHDYLEPQWALLSLSQVWFSWR